MIEKSYGILLFRNTLDERPDVKIEVMNEQEQRIREENEESMEIERCIAEAA